MTWAEFKKEMKKNKVPDNAKMIKIGWEEDDEDMLGGRETEDEIMGTQYYEKTNQVEVT